MTDPAFRHPEDILETGAADDKAARKRAAQAARDYAETFGGVAGKRVLDDLIGRFAGVTYTRGDHIHTAYREGQRAVIEHIAQAIGRAERKQEESEYERVV